jgi:subtilisin family serine protease
MIKMLLSMTFAQSILAASTMAILDNQIDYTHNRLSDHLWTNSVELRNNIDDDNNGFVDDINGWNFIDDSNKLFDFSGYGSFPSDVYKYYEVRAKKTLGTITEKELEWYNKTRKDPDFKEIKKKFSKFSHGTHVACLAMDMSLLPSPLVQNDLKFMPIKYLGEAKSGAFVRPEFKPLEKGSEKEKIKHISKYIESYKVWMLGKLEVAISYASGNADVIHGSWGQGYGTTKKIVEGLFDDQFEKHEKFTDLKKTMTDSFIADLVDRGTDLLSEYKENLFVFSAGNKKEDTDVELHYPSSILLSNVISVAASDRDSEKAYFSNFGQSTVSIFAPGIAIESCVPENRKLPINGTSQAAPQVSSVALKLFALLNELEIKVNPSLVKTLILKTVDKTEQLTKLSASGGILNPKRAFSAAKRLKKMSLKEAIAQSYVDFPNP